MGLMFEKPCYPVFCKAHLSDIGKYHSLRCDSKQFEGRFLEFETLIEKSDVFFLGDLLPLPLIKGSQPNYIEGAEGIPVINTLSIQNLRINIEDCRYISEDDYDSIIEARKLQKNDVLLTMDGGTSIGKPVLFNLDGSYTVDSHIPILRNPKISEKAWVYLLASPIGQLQFNRAESGASGQTSVTEEDLRRFRFPTKLLAQIDALAKELDLERKKINLERCELDKREHEAWEQFSLKCLCNS